MIEGCLLLVVVLIILGYGIVSIIPWWFIGLVIACVLIVTYMSDGNDDY
jgi:hypothetical protein